MTYSEAGELAQRAADQAGGAIGQTNDQAVKNIAIALRYLAQSQKALAEQLERDNS